MSIARTAVFWSYAHDDDSLDGGRILKLCQALTAEYNLLNPQPIEIFVDRSSLQWGNEWRHAIDTAISDAAFLIAIVTPRYLDRPECRRELLEFSGQAASRDLSELVLPILYVGVENLRADAPDPAARIVARTQFVDWRVLRLADENSVEYRSAVNALAVRLAGLLQDVTARQLEREASQSTPEDSEEDLVSLLEHAEALWSDWVKTVISDDARASESLATAQHFSERRRKLRNAHAPASTIAATYLQQGARTLPLTKEHEVNAELYSVRTMELDPLMRAAVNTGRERPSSAGLLRELRERIAEALEVIGKQVPREKAEANRREFEAEMPYITSTWKEVFRIAIRGNMLVAEANGVVIRWAQELEAILTEPHAFAPEHEIIKTEPEGPALLQVAP